MEKYSTTFSQGDCHWQTLFFDFFILLGKGTKTITQSSLCPSAEEGGRGTRHTTYIFFKAMHVIMFCQWTDSKEPIWFVMDYH